jgi:hypothetical protein
MSSRLLPFGALVVVALFACSQEAAAQGRGRPKAPKAPKAPAPAAATVSTPSLTALTSATSTTTPVSPAVSFRQFGSWLDDASAAIAHEGRTGMGIGYWRMDGGSQVNMPMLDIGYAFTDRIQASASVPFYYSRYAGSSARGLDDIYLAGKMTLIDPALTVSEFGLAVSPVVEVLGPGSADGRIHYAAPVSVELRRQPFRVFGSAGYFSRGSVFTGGAMEWTAANGAAVTGAVTQSYSTRADTTLDTLGISRQRVDVTGSIAYPLGQVAAAYVSVGRSLNGLDEGGTAFSLAGGISLRFSTATAKP